MCARRTGPRARDLGVVPGTFQPGPLNAITDVAGVRVGQATVIAGDSVRTGVTAILPHGGNLFLDRVPAAIHVGNGFGKLLGVTQVEELGELETPILLTCTLCVWRAADAMVAWLLAQPGMERGALDQPRRRRDQRRLRLNAIRCRPDHRRDVRAALDGAATGPVAEGSVGAGAGTIAFGWKGGIGTSSRGCQRAAAAGPSASSCRPTSAACLQVLGAPVGRALGRVRVSRDAPTRQGAATARS